MRQFKSIAPYDRVMMDDRCWSVSGVYIGALNHEDIIELHCADGTHADRQLLVPLALIPAEAIFRAVDHERLRLAA